MRRLRRVLRRIFRRDRAVYVSGPQWAKIRADYHWQKREKATRG